MGMQLNHIGLGLMASVTADVSGDLCCWALGSEDILCRMPAMPPGGEVGVILAMLATRVCLGWGRWVP